MVSRGWSSVVVKMACLLAIVYLLVEPAEAIHHHKLVRLMLFKGFLKRPLHIPIPLPLPIPVHKDEWGHKSIKVPLPDIRLSVGHKKHNHHQKYHIHDLHHLHEHHHSLPLSDFSFDSGFEPLGPAAIDLPIIEPALPKFAGIASKLSDIEHEPFLPHGLDTGGFSSAVLDHVAAPPAALHDDYDGGFSGGETSPAFADDVALPLLPEIPPVEEALEAPEPPIKFPSLPGDNAFSEHEAAHGGGIFDEAPAAPAGFYGSSSYPPLPHLSTDKLAAPEIDLAMPSAPIGIAPAEELSRAPALDHLKLAAEFDLHDGSHSEAQMPPALASQELPTDGQHPGPFHEPVPYAKDDLKLTEHAADGKVAKSHAV